MFAPPPVFRVVTLFALTLALSGCSYDPYRPYDDGVGYSEAQIAPDLWQVYYEGPRSMSRGQAVEYAQLRAAEIAQRENKSYFRIVDSTSALRTETDVHRDFDGFDYSERRRLYGPYFTYADTYSRPAGVLRVRLLDEPETDALDTAAVLDPARQTATRPS